MLNVRGEDGNVVDWSGDKLSTGQLATPGTETEEFELMLRDLAFDYINKRKKEYWLKRLESCGKSPPTRIWNTMALLLGHDRDIIQT